jgi:hypothetical protein
LIPIYQYSTAVFDLLMLRYYREVEIQIRYDAQFPSLPQYACGIVFYPVVVVSLKAVGEEDRPSF